MHAVSRSRVYKLDSSFQFFCAAKLAQVLGLPYVLQSVSESEASYRSMVRSNHGKKLRKIFETVEDQLRYHRSMPGAQVTDLLVTGSPCNPFSTQRCKRYQTGDVLEHSKFSLTESIVTGLYQTLCPKIGVTEQVEGFERPFSTGNSDTPLAQLLGTYQAILVMFFFSKPLCQIPFCFG